MAWSNTPASMEYDDDDMLDRRDDDGKDPPAYPPNLLFTIDEADLIKAIGTAGKTGNITPFSAMAEVTSVHNSTQGDRVEMRINQFAGEDGHFFETKFPGHICFCNFEMGKMDLEADCEVGDMIHLIGEARLESISRSEFGEMATLQIVKLTYEDESVESREHE